MWPVKDGSHLSIIRRFSTIKTVPRIELCSAKLSVELLTKLKSEIEYEITKTYYWTDSSTVLKYIKNEDKRFHRFVANKVSFIRNFSHPDQWFYVPTKLNPADIISRGSSPESLIKSSLWNCGPNYLRLGNAQFPSQEISTSFDESDEVHSDAMTLTSIVESTPLDELMNSSSWDSLKVKVAWFLRLRRLLHEKVRLDPQLTADDLSLSVINIVKYLQNKYYPNEMTYTRSRSNLPKSSPLIKLCPFIDDDDILRVGGRLKNTKAPFDIVHPIILPSCYITELIIQDVHAATGHMGRETVLNQIRKKFWIIKANSTTRRIIRGCITCRKVQGKPEEQLMANLPNSRVTGDVPAFTNTGCDLFGPFFVTHE